MHGRRDDLPGVRWCLQCAAGQEELSAPAATRIPKEPDAPPLWDQRAAYAAEARSHWARDAGAVAGGAAPPAAAAPSGAGVAPPPPAAPFFGAGLGAEPPAGAAFGLPLALFSGPTPFAAFGGDLGSAVGRFVAVTTTLVGSGAGAPPPPPGPLPPAPLPHGPREPGEVPAPAAGGWGFSTISLPI